jgi:hypothetical protein
LPKRFQALAVVEIETVALFSVPLTIPTFTPEEISSSESPSTSTKT